MATDLRFLFNEKETDKIARLQGMLQGMSTEERQRLKTVFSFFLSDEDLLRMLRDEDDDVLRNFAFETIKFKGRLAVGFLKTCLELDDEDVVLMAVQLLSSIEGPEATKLLIRALSLEWVNVQQAAIVGIGRRRDKALVDHLVPFLEKKFWLKCAAVEAFGEIGSHRVIPMVKPILDDEILLPTSLNALSKIGGKAAFFAIADKWTEREGGNNDESYLRAMALCLGKISERPELSGPLLSRLEDVASKDPFAGPYSLFILLFAGKNVHAQKTVSWLSMIAGELDFTRLFSVRPDLIPHFMEKGDSFLMPVMTALDAKKASQETLLELFVKCGAKIEALELFFDKFGGALTEESLKEILPGMDKMPDRILFSLYPVLKNLARHPGALLASRGKLSLRTGIVVSTIFPSLDESTRELFSELDIKDAAAILRHISLRRRLLMMLDWRSWLERDIDLFAPIAARHFETKAPGDLTGIIRADLARRASPALLTAAGLMKDTGSIPALRELYKGGLPHLRSLSALALAKIGSNEAKSAILELIGSADDSEKHQLISALSVCDSLSRDDLPLFLDDFRNSGNTSIRIIALETIARLDYQKFMGIAKDALLDQDPVVSERTVTLLTCHGLG